MVVNGLMLLEAAPIKNMLNEKVSHNGVSHGLAEVGYDIRIKQDVWFWPAVYHFLGDLRTAERVSVDDKDRFTTGRFALASAIEEFDMPSDLVGIVHDKSTWARKGLSVFNTVIEPGWKGFLTLELVYHGQEPLHIPAGSGIAQVVFHYLTETAAYGGKYQNQADEPVPAIMEKLKAYCSADGCHRTESCGPFCRDNGNL